MLVSLSHTYLSLFFCLYVSATAQIYTLSLHDALPIYFFLSNFAGPAEADNAGHVQRARAHAPLVAAAVERGMRSEEHTSELQSRQYLVCRLLLEKKKSDSQGPPPSWPAHVRTNPTADP